MSVSYSIDIKTHALFNKETIKKIYDTASALHYSFFKVEETGLNMAGYLSFEELYDHITRSPEMEDDFPGMLWLQIQNTTLLCQITEGDNNLLELHFSPDLWLWKNWFRNHDNCIDYQRYFRSLLILCAEFPIDSIKTYTFY